MSGMRRIAVVGSSGSGKTTMARTLADQLGLTHIELDALHHQANWTPLDREQMRRRLSAAMDAAHEGWAMCGSYGATYAALMSNGDWDHLTVHRLRSPAEADVFLTRLR